MSTINRQAHIVGALYIVMAVVMIVGYMYMPATFYVSGDAAGTARNITEGIVRYRIAILAALVSQILFIVVVLRLYELFKDVDRRLARLILALVCAGAAAEIANLVHRLAPLVLLSGADYLAVFTKPQLAALAFGSLNAGNRMGELALLIWGLWLFPFGRLVIKSGFFPKPLGVLLYMTGVAYATSCVTALLFPEHLPAVSKILLPLYFAELPVVFWFAIKGARASP